MAPEGASSSLQESVVHILVVLSNLAITNNNLLVKIWNMRLV